MRGSSDDDDDDDDAQSDAPCIKALWTKIAIVTLFRLLGLMTLAKRMYLEEQFQIEVRASFIVPGIIYKKKKKSLGVVLC